MTSTFHGEGTRGAAQRLHVVVLQFDPLACEPIDGRGPHDPLLTTSKLSCQTGSSQSKSGSCIAKQKRLSSVLVGRLLMLPRRLLHKQRLNRWWAYRCGVRHRMAVRIRRVMIADRSGISVVADIIPAVIVRQDEQLCNLTRHGSQPSGGSMSERPRSVRCGRTTCGFFFSALACSSSLFKLTPPLSP